MAEPGLTVPAAGAGAGAGAGAPARAAAPLLGLLATALLASCISLLALAAPAYLLWRQAPPPLATLDLQRLVEEDQQRQLARLATEPDSAPERRRALAENMSADFARRLSAGVAQLGQECGCVLVNKAALLAGPATDYTALLRQRLQP